MKLLVIGASRGVGLQMVQQALHTGHTVTAFARSAGEMPMQHRFLAKISGDFHDPVAVSAVMPGQDAVIITASLGMLQLKRQPEFYSRGTTQVLAAMKQHGVPRIVILSNFAAGDGDKLLNPLERLFTNLFIREATDDHTRQEQLVSNSGLQWTVARPSRLTHDPARSRYQVVSGQRVPSCISRADVAAFLLQAATTELWLGQTVNIGG